MRFSQTMRFVSLWIFIIGFSANVLAQGNGRVRVLRVRKTGEFGKRIEPISTYYQPPTRHFRANEPSLETSETRRFSRLVGIRKPSQQLQLPFQTQVDQESQETVESPQGYAYPSPPKQGYADTPAPFAEYPNLGSEEEQQSLDESPVPVVPVIEAEETPDQGSPFAAEAQENIDAEQGNAPPAEDPIPVQNAPQAEVPAKCDENDHDCWPHGYGGEIPGEAGTDYPVLSEIVDTPFECDSVQYSGYYADADDQARCQIFHICLKGNKYRKTQKWSFLCPNGTVFSQNDFVCVWWNNAPECNRQNVDELSLRNVELGWDNLTETGSNSAGSSNFDVRSAMSSLFNANLQPSSSNSRLKNTLPEPTTTRRPYRVPVKVNTGTGARTQLKEVTNNALQGQSEYQDGFEHDGEESEAYETSLSQQSEARRKSKTASALLKSESEAYEQKSVPDSVEPFIVSRTPVESDDSIPNIPQQGPYEDEEEVPSMVMMQAQQRNPDGSEGFAEVPVMINGGYRYPNPTSTPGPKYLPPQNEYSQPSTTESPTTTTQLPTTEESYESEGGYQYQTTEEPSEPSFSPQVQVTTEEPGYNYPNPTTTEASGYDYSAPTTTEQSGYSYPNPTTSEQSGYSYPTPTTTEASYQEQEFSSPVYEEQNGGYEKESTTVPQVPERIFIPVTERQTTTPAELTSTVANLPEGGYLPPKSEGGYDSPRAAASLKAAADIIALPNADNEEENKSTVTIPTVSDSSEDYIDEGADLATVNGNDVTEGGYGEKEATLPYHIPTPASSTVGATGANLDAQKAQVDDILKQIQSGGAEVRDESGNKVDFEILKKLLSSPSGLLALQKADQSVTPDSSTSSSTEVPTTKAIVSETPEAPQVVTPTLETLQTIEDFNDNQAPVQQTYVENRAPQPTYFTSQVIPQQSYYSNDRVVNVQHPTYAINAPSKEFESHTVQQNSISSSLRSQDNTYSAGLNQYQTQSQESYQKPQTQTVQNFAPTQQTSNELSYPSPQTYTEQQQNYPSNVEYVRPSVPQPERYYEQQPQVQQSPQNSIRSQPSSYFQTEQPQRQIQQNIIPQSNLNQNYQQPQQSFFQQQTQPEIAQYLPPPVSNSQAQIYSPAPTQSRASIPRLRDLTENIQLQHSFAYPVPQASSNANNRQLTKSPIEFKIVPAVLVNQQTVEEPLSASERSNIYQRPNYNFQQRPVASNLNNNNPQFRQYIPYTSQTEIRPVIVQAPRSPKYEPFTAEDGRTAEQIQKYHHADLRKFHQQNARPTNSASSYSRSLSTRQSVPVVRRNGRHYIGSGSRGELELPSEQSSISNTYPGRDGSLGVKLTYN